MGDSKLKFSDFDLWHDPWQAPPPIAEQLAMVHRSLESKPENP